MNKCKSCGADIIWIKMEATDAKMPVDEKPIYKLALTKGKLIKLYSSHFETCPNAKQWRADFAEALNEVTRKAGKDKPKKQRLEQK